MNNSFTIFKKFYYTAAFLTGCCFVGGCENKKADIDAWTQKVTMVEVAKNMESFLSQEGIVKAKLTAPLMLRVMSDTVPYVEFPNSLHVDFYNDSIRIESWLDSKYGKYFENMDKVYLRDSVVVINIKGDTLKCKDLWWDQNTKTFYTDKYAEYHAIGKNIYGGKGMEATQDMSSVTFKQPTGIVNVNNEGLQ